LLSVTLHAECVWLAMQLGIPVLGCKPGRRPKGFGTVAVIVLCVPGMVVWVDAACLRTAAALYFVCDVVCVVAVSGGAFSPVGVFSVSR
jgi:hypothetical protein